MVFSKKGKKVVVIGGGTGTFTVLTGLKGYTPDLTAVVSMSDSGGSTGRLRDEFGILPPGDVRRALLALSSSPEQLMLRRLFEYRFNKGSGLSGHSFGNLFLAALTDIVRREDKAIEEAGKILNIAGRVLPVTLSHTNLCARLEDGTIIKGETNIDLRRVRPDLKILDVFLDAPATI
ncbi:MAG: YvcK family protein, partial [Candidatus Blackburnbacteria bacterium]|nr:YvcK family protein [Candidatus Blackburnbacteria bacterium]